jgi:hypothetical protein
LRAELRLACLPRNPTSQSRGKQLTQSSVSSENLVERPPNREQHDCRKPANGEQENSGVFFVWRH